MMVNPYYDNIGLLKDICADLPTRIKGRPLSRHRESKDAFTKKKVSKKMAKASRRRNRR